MTFFKHDSLPCKTPLHTFIALNTNFRYSLNFKSVDRVLDIEKFNLWLEFVMVDGIETDNCHTLLNLRSLTIHQKWPARLENWRTELGCKSHFLCWIMQLEQFSLECRKTKTKVITLANQKGHRAIHCPIQNLKQLHKAWENLCKQVTIGFGFTCDWLRKLHVFF